MPGHTPTTVCLNERVETVRVRFVRQKTAGKASLGFPTCVLGEGEFLLPLFKTLLTCLVFPY